MRITYILEDNDDDEEESDNGENDSKNKKMINDSDHNGDKVRTYVLMDLLVVITEEDGL